MRLKSRTTTNNKSRTQLTARKSISQVPTCFSNLPSSFKEKSNRSRKLRKNSKTSPLKNKYRNLIW
jgi:hypothetical protein